MTTEEEKPDILIIKDILKGQRPVAILGGGESLLASFPLIPKDSFLIDVNGHSWLNEVCVPDMIFSSDNAVSHKIWQRAIGLSKPIPISIIERYSKYRLNKDIYDLGFSGSVATCIGLYLGGDPVLLLGMDLYMGKKLYFHSKEEGIDEEHKWSLKEHLDTWKLLLINCTHTERIKVINSSLREIFGEWSNAQ